MAALLFTTPSSAWPPISVLYVGNAANAGRMAPGSRINVQVIGGTLKGLEEVPLTFTSSDGQEFIAMGVPSDAGNMTAIVPEEVPVGHTELSVNLDGVEISAAVDIVEYAPCHVATCFGSPGRSVRLRWHTGAGLSPVRNPHN